MENNGAREPFTINGWFNFAYYYEDVFSRLIDRRAPIRILEIGVFQGASTCFLAGLISRARSPQVFEFHCCDIFEIHAEYQCEGFAEGDCFRQVFERNLSKLDLAEFVRVHQGRSEDVLATFPDRHFDFIFIDGDHSFDCVCRELELGLAKLKCDGILAGHDLGLPGVASALKQQGLTYIHSSLGDVWEVVDR